MFVRICIIPNVPYHFIRLKKVRYVIFLNVLIGKSLLFFPKCKGGILIITLSVCGHQVMPPTSIPRPSCVQSGCGGAPGAAVVDGAPANSGCFSVVSGSGFSLLCSPSSVFGSESSEVVGGRGERGVHLVCSVVGRGW